MRIAALVGSSLTLTLIIFLNTNASYVDNSLNQSLAESRKLSQLMAANSLSPYVVKMVVAQKRIVTNFISAKTRSRHCQDLLDYDSTTLGGNYLVYPERMLDNPSLVNCDIRAGKVFSQSFIKRKQPVALDQDWRNFQSVQTISCRSNLATYGASKYNKSVCRGNGMIAGAPKLIEDLHGGNNCVLNYSYGVGSTGLWVDKGCAGRFEVQLLPFVQ